MVSGPADRERLEQITKAVYEQLDKTGSRKSLSLFCLFCLFGT